MTDMHAACLLKELRDYNLTNRMTTPQMDHFDAIFDCAFDHAIRALEQKAGYEPGTVPYIKRPNGCYSVPGEDD